LQFPEIFVALLMDFIQKKNQIRFYVISIYIMIINLLIPNKIIVFIALAMCTICTGFSQAEDFSTFLRKFSVGSVFQRERVVFPMSQISWFLVKYLDYDLE